MKTNPLLGHASGLIQQKLSAYNEIENKIEVIRRQELRLQKALLDQAPEGLKKSLEGWLLTTLQFGVASWRAPVSYFGESYDDAKRRLDQLKKAWEGAIKVTFSTKKDVENEGRLVIRFSIL